MNSSFAHSFPLFTALVSPFDASGAIDFTSFRRLVEMQLEAKNGLVLFGSTGEGLSLDEDEKRTILQFVKELVRHAPVPVIVAVPGFHLPSVLRWIEYCEASGVDGYLLPTPLYTKPGLHGQVQWFSAILDAVSKPCMIYNVPSRSGVRLHPEALFVLQKHSNLWAVKESSGSAAEFLQFRKKASDLAYYCGDDGLMPEFGQLGALGLVSVASNLWPFETRSYLDACRRPGTRYTSPAWQQGSASLFLASNPIPVKLLLHHLGLINHPFVRPPLSLKDLPDLSPLVTAHQDIKNWLATNF